MKAKFLARVQKVNKIAALDEASQFARDTVTAVNGHEINVTISRSLGGKLIPVYYISSDAAGHIYEKDRTRINRFLIDGYLGDFVAAITEVAERNTVDEAVQFARDAIRAKGVNNVAVLTGHMRKEVFRAMRNTDGSVVEEDNTERARACGWI